MRLRIDEIGRDFRYLRWDPNLHNLEFGSWLTTLDFPRLPFGLEIEDLVRSGLLAPALRVDLPAQFYIAWRNYPVLPADDATLPENLRWCWANALIPFADKDTPHWYLSPYDRPGNSECAQFIANAVKPHDTPWPPSFRHPNGHNVIPTTMYFRHWQGYFIADLLPALPLGPVMIGGIPKRSDPSALVRDFERISGFAQALRDSVIERWNKLGAAFDLCAYYRNLYSAAYSSYPHDAPKSASLVDIGAVELAGSLSVSVEQLEDSLVQLLQVFQRWKRFPSTLPPVPENSVIQLQKDIYYIVEWLCKLTKRESDFYFECFTQRGRMVSDTASLHEALPEERYVSRSYFRSTATYYLDQLNVVLPEGALVSEKELDRLVEELWGRNPPFVHFVTTFRRMHQEIGLEQTIDFVASSRMDHFLLIFMRVESFLRRLVEADVDTSLNSVLKTARSRMENANPIAVALDRALGRWDRTHFSYPEDPFAGSIQTIQTASGQEVLDEYVVLFVRSRNYLAHHEYRDDDLLDPIVIEHLFKSVLIMMVYLPTAIRSPAG